MNIPIVENLNAKTNISSKTKAEIIYELTLAYIPNCNEHEEAKAISYATSMYDKLLSIGIITEMK